MKIVIHSILMVIVLSLMGCNKNKYKTHLINDLSNGIDTIYYENGSIKMYGAHINNLATGWHYFYNINQRIDSIIEYVPVNADSPLDSFLKKEKYTKNFSMRNRHVIYKNGEIDYGKSLFFEILLRKDTVLLGDTVNVALNFANQSNNQRNNFKIYFKDDDNLIILHFEDLNNGEKLTYFYFIAKARGQQVLRGTIEEYLPAKEIKYWFFEKPYYVR